MPSIRIVTAGAVFLVLATGGAQAQTATDTAAPGKPIPLLHVLTQPSQAKTRTHFKSRRLSRRYRKSHIAALRRRWKKRPVAAAKVTPPAATMSAANIWPAVPTATAANVTTTESPAAAPASTMPVPSELVVGGRTVQVASPDRANAIDLAAGAGAAAKDSPAARIAGPTTPTADPAATSAPAPGDTVGAAAKSDSMKAAPPQKDSPVGSASWIAQVLAALGGAVAAGSLAWILIGSAPQRTYG